MKTIVILFTVLSLVVPARAATFTVTTLADPGNGACTPATTGDGCTLREAITVANSAAGADTIVFAAGVTGAIQLTGALPKLTTNINLQGPGANLLTVRRDSGGDYHIFHVSIGTSCCPTVSISGLTIANGRAFSNSFPANTGGGLLNESGIVTVSNCMFSGNSADVFGGGLANLNGTLTLSHCVLNGNSIGPNFTGSGGGIANQSSAFNDARLTVQNSTLSGNTSNSSGGGIINQSGQGGTATLTVQDSTLSGNSADFGGGILSSSGKSGVATVIVQNSTLANNSADFGGGIYNESDADSTNSGTATLTVQNSTLSGNSGDSGGGIFHSNIFGGSANLMLGNTILQTGASGPNIGSRGTPTMTSQGFNLCDDNGGGFLNQSTDQTFTDARLDPAGLQDNGGPMPTIALLPDSPARDKGKNLGGAATDQRGTGFARTVNFAGIANASGGDGTDIGAFEVQDNPQSGPTFVVNTKADGADITGCSEANCTLREAIATANGNAGANTIVFAPNLVGAITLTQGQLTVTDSVTINGPGARSLAVNGNGASRVFLFLSGSSVMNNLSISNGKVAGGPGAAASGGGIFNQAELIVRDCALGGHQALGGDGVSGGKGGAGLGGAAFNAGTLTFNRCSFNGNKAIGGAGGDDPHGVGGNGGAGLGGAVFNAAGATLNLNNCTFSGNTGSGGAGGDAPLGGPNGTASFGGDGGDGSGALFNQGTMTVTNSTFSGNSGSGGAAGIGLVPSTNGTPGIGSGGLTNRGSASDSTVRSTIIAGNTGNNGGGRDVDGAFTSEGFNLIGSSEHSTGFTAATDLTGTDAAPRDPKLGPHINNGGSTNTMALQSGSPAIDQGNSFGVRVDQRTRTRPVDNAAIPNAPGGDGSDIGAFEFGATFTALPKIAIDDVTVVEGNSGSRNAYFTVTLSEPSATIVTVSYATAAGTTNPATAGSDYLASSGTLSFPPGQVAQILSVPILGDGTDEENETFFVTLSNPVNAQIADKKGVGTITDDDVPPSLSVNDVTVTEGGNGATSLANFKVSLSAVSSKTITVSYATANSSAVAPGDYTATSGTLTFAPGKTSKTIAVTVNGDATDENNETFFVNLSNASNATIADAQGVGTITDDDAPPTLSISDVTIVEGSGTNPLARFTVSLSAASGKTVTVSYATADGTALANSDYVAKSGTLTFNPGQTSKVVAVTVLGDAVDEADEVFKVDLSDATNATIADNRGRGTITDDDGPTAPSR